MMFSHSFHLLLYLRQNPATPDVKSNNLNEKRDSISKGSGF